MTLCETKAALPRSTQFVVYCIILICFGLRQKSEDVDKTVDVKPHFMDWKGVVWIYVKSLCFIHMCTRGICQSQRAMETLDGPSVMERRSPSAGGGVCPLAYVSLQSIKRITVFGEWV